MRFAHRLILTAAALGTTLIAAGPAQAESLDACGDIFFEGGGSIECTVEVEGGCTAKCEPIAFEAQCAAELTVGCNGGCNATADVGCTGTCQGSCEADCTEGQFDCQATCEGNCTADCAGNCMGSANGGECNASCEATCQSECSANCNVTAPDCTAQCQGCCQGECRAEANIDCQIDCQASGYVDCKAELQGGCEVACSEPEGAVFCNGQWVNTSNVESCVAAIEAAFNIEVSYSAECSGNTCKAEASASCAMSPESPAAPGFGSAALLLGLASAGLTVSRRLRRRTQK